VILGVGGMGVGVGGTGVGVGRTGLPAGGTVVGVGGTGVGVTGVGMAAGASERGIAGGAAHPVKNNITHATTIKRFFISDLLSLISGIGLLPSNSANV